LKPSEIAVEDTGGDARDGDERRDLKRSWRRWTVLDVAVLPDHAPAKAVCFKRLMADAHRGGRRADNWCSRLTSQKRPGSKDWLQNPLANERPTPLPILALTVARCGRAAIRTGKPVHADNPPL